MTLICIRLVFAEIYTNTISLHVFSKTTSALSTGSDSYAQCIPTRFKKDIIRAAKEAETEHIALEGLQKVIANIGASSKVSRHDMELIFFENGVSGRISTEQMLKIL